MKIEQASDLKIPTKRLSLGYFYVQKNRIMRIWENNDYEAQGNVWTLSKKTLNRIIKTSEIPKYSTIVWQKKTYKDTLKHDKIDWHQYLKRFKIRPKRDCVMVATINIHSIQDIGRLLFGKKELG